MMVPTYQFGDDIYMVAENFSQVWYMLEWESFLPQLIEVFINEDEPIVDVYAVWYVSYEKIGADVPIYFKSTHPVSRFLYIVETKDDVINFEPDQPLWINHVRLLGHITGLQPNGYYFKIAYKVMSINYGYVGYYLSYFNWVWKFLFLRF